MRENIENFSNIDIRYLQVGILSDNVEAKNYLSNGFGKKIMCSDIRSNLSIHLIELDIS
jgi:hypothetical protein